MGKRETAFQENRRGSVSVNSVCKRNRVRLISTGKTQVLRHRIDVGLCHIVGAIQGAGTYPLKGTAVTAD